MFFLVTVEVHNLEYVFPNPAFSAGGKSGASIFLILVLLLIQILIFFHLFPRFLIKSLATSNA